MVPPVTKDKVNMAVSDSCQNSLEAAETSLYHFINVYKPMKWEKLYQFQLCHAQEYLQAYKQPFHNA